MPYTLHKYKQLIKTGFVNGFMTQQNVCPSINIYVFKTKLIENNYLFILSHRLLLNET